MTKVTVAVPVPWSLVASDSGNLSVLTPKT